MKIVHLSDLHIRNYKFYREFDETLDNLFESLQEISPDLIVFCGDLFHTKNYVSGEAISLARKFLNGISSIAPTKVILGNHDVNANNLVRTSPVVPICGMIDNVELYFGSGMYEYLDGDVPLNFVVYSVIDAEKFDVKTGDFKKDMVNIGLGHFCVGGSHNSYGFVFENNNSVLTKANTESFKHLDYIMLGDIHQQQQLDKAGKSRYAGAMLQNNFGESPESGFLVWDIHGKDDFDVEFIELDSPLKFHTVEITSGKRLPKDFNPPIGSRIRISINSDISFSDIAALKSRIISRFKPKDIREVYGTSIGGIGGFNIDDLKIEMENIRNPNIQATLIREYFKDRTDISEDTLSEAIEFNLELDTQIAVDSVVRNVVWNFERFQFDNYFNYGEDNSIDFSKLRGKIVLVGGGNARGKSGIIDSAVHTLFNTTKRNITRNYDYVNSRRNGLSGILELSLGDRRYFIEREVSKANDSKISRTDLGFSCVDSDGKKYNMNGEQRFDTEKNIRAVFGTSDDLFISSLSSQGDITSFVEKGATGRKEVLMKFLDLYFFDEKYDLVMEHSKNTRVRLKEYEEVDFDDYIDEFEVLVEELEYKLDKINAVREGKKEEYLSLERERAELKASLKDIEIVDIVKVRKDIERADKEISDILKKIEYEKELLSSLEGKKKKIVELCDNFDIDDINKRKDRNDKIRMEKSEIAKEKSSTLKFIEQLSKTVSVLDDVTCGGKGKFAKCPLISEATAAKLRIPEIKKTIKSNNERIAEIEEMLNGDENDKIVSRFNQISSVLEKKSDIELKILSSKAKISSYDNDLSSLKGGLSLLEGKEERYDEAIEQKKKNKQALERLGIVEVEVGKLSEELDNISTESSTMNKELGSNTAMMNEWVGKKNDYVELTRKYGMYNVLLECFGKGGIPNKIMSDKLPLINATINNLLDDVVSFRIQLSQGDSNSIDVDLLYPDSISRPLSIASGMEKMVSSLAIRAGLCLISNLPRSSTFIVDEGFGALDKDKVVEVEAIFHKLKKHFSSIIIITHVPELKDMAEVVLDISVDENHDAHINV